MSMTRTLPRADQCVEWRRCQPLSFYRAFRAWRYIRHRGCVYEYIYCVYVLCVNILYVSFCRASRAWLYIRRRGCIYEYMYCAHILCICIVYMSFCRASGAWCYIHRRDCICEYMYCVFVLCICHFAEHLEHGVTLVAWAVKCNYMSPLQKSPIKETIFCKDLWF